MVEGKKEAFRKYLESAGVVNLLTNVLVALYEEQNKPESATEYIKNLMGGPTAVEYEKLIDEKLELQRALAEAKKRLPDDAAPEHDKSTVHFSAS